MTTLDTSAFQSQKYNDFIINHYHVKGDNKNITHTRIGGDNIKGGSFTINKEELGEFYKLYYNHVFVNKKMEYLTEKQLDTKGPLLVDLDFRYDLSVTERQHSSDQVIDIIQLYLEEFKKLFVLDGEGDKVPKVPVFVLEKPNVNRVIDKDVTKDGIHIIFGVQMDHTLQLILRDRVLTEINEVIDLPLKNDWPNVLDEGISKGTTNWQLFGSRKPGNEAYELSKYYLYEFDASDNTWFQEDIDLSKFDLSTNFQLLSAQYDKHVCFKMNPDIEDEYKKYSDKRRKPTNNATNTTASNTTASNINANTTSSNNTTNNYNTTANYSNIGDYQTLHDAVEHIMTNLKTNEYYIKEIHEYTQILPEKYYCPGSHLLNRQVAFALKHTDERLFLSWIMLRAKAHDFEYHTIPSLYDKWRNFRNNEKGLTKRSIIYWAKQDAFADYEGVKKNTIDAYIENTIFEAGEWDYALVLYHVYKDKYVCCSIKHHTWYVFKDHRWVQDNGISLRSKISTHLFQLYSEKQNQCLVEAQQHDANNSKDLYEKIQRKIKKLAEICVKLKKTSDKNNIIRESMEIFFDDNFIKNIDTNPYLMCFQNGIFDFKTKEFRQGYPQDYVTKSTNIPYEKYNYSEPEQRKISDEITIFMTQLFPKKELCRYMWDHLASCLIGIKKEHVFNIYRGSGSNGKSILTDLMSNALGEYKGVVPITLVTDKRGAIGGTSSEVIQLKGVRYAVMQEPSKDAVINEGILKELTGGDPIQARALFSDSEIFIPQFSLVVCTNALFEIKSNDDGTWRRMKLVDFLAKFVSKDETHTDDTPYVFPKDKTLKERLPSWAKVFIAMLVDIACKTGGEVVDCPEVVAASNKYRDSQDCLSGFIYDKIVTDESGTISSKRALYDQFKNWFQMNFGNKKCPKLTELIEAMKSKYIKGGSKIQMTLDGKWTGIKIKNDDGDEEDTLAQLS